ncbi:MAG: cobalt ECF transporter T component CbiQ [Lachnospiraceae bacterium]|nr:cobalt ECF transporter T component CbiQ [bacterium]MDY5518271.1 cobalt ECF transporter T component CbiQ [Lachnospiraceae bacterium]
MVDQLSRAQDGFRELDEMAAGRSVIHRLHPLCKLIVTIAYIFCVVSFHKYDFSGLAVMLLYPVVLFQAAKIPMHVCVYKLRMVLPLVCAVGLANPFLDHRPVILIGNLVITGGVVSMLTLMLKGCLALMASFLLVATTPIDGLCGALRKVHVPKTLTTLLLLVYRYIGVMLGEASAMVQAYSLRAPGQKGIHVKAWGSFLGQLLLRSADRAQELYSSMLLRGFCGEFFYSEVPACGVGSVLFTGGSMAFFVCARLVNIAQLIGTWVVK